MRKENYYFINCRLTTVLYCLLIIYSQIAFSQQSLIPTLHSSAIKDYSKYLASLSLELTPPRIDTPIAFDKLTMIMVAIDKTHVWTRATGKQARDLLAKNTIATRHFTALHALLTDDVKPIIAVWSDRTTEPDYASSQAAIKILREHGYPLAADVLLTLSRNLSDQRVIAWAGLPKDKRAPIDQYMLKRYLPYGQNRRALVQTILRLFLKPPAKCAVEAKAFYALALLFGKGTGELNLNVAQQWYSAGKTAEGKQLLFTLLDENPASISLFRQALFVLNQVSDFPSIALAYQRALTNMREPYVREIRLDYVAYLRELVKVHQPTPAPDRNPNALLNIDALLGEEKYAEAAAKYVALLHDARATAEVRLDAWSGLLDSDPAAALEAGETLGEVLTRVDAATRAPLLRWCGWQLNRAVLGEMPPDPHRIFLLAPQHFRPLHAAAAWETKSAALLDRLLAIDAVACLRPDTQNNLPALRTTAALIYALARQGEPAYQALARPIDYEIPPPPGGWTAFDGSPDVDAKKPHRGASPLPGDTEQSMDMLADILARYQWKTMQDNVPTGIGLPMSAAAIQHLCAELAKEQDPKVIPAKLKQLSIELKQAAMALDPLPAINRTDLPPPPVRPVDLAQFAPLAQAVRTALQNDAVARNAKPLLDGLLGALTIAANPQFTDTLFTLLTNTLSRYAATTDLTRSTYEAHRLATALANRPIYDMKPYAQKLREKYPKQ